MELDEMFWQFERYGGLFSKDIHRILEEIVELNDDLWHARDISSQKETIINLIKGLKDR